MKNKYIYFSNFFFYIELDNYLIGNKLAYFKYKFNSNFYFYTENNIFYRFKFFFNELNIEKQIEKKILSSFFLFLRSNFFGHIKHLKLEGRGYKLYNYINMLILKLGYSHLCYFLLPINVIFLSKRKKFNYKLFSFSHYLIGNLLYKIQSFKVPNTYKKKGIFIT